MSNKNPKQEILPEWVVMFDMHHDNVTYSVVKVYEEKIMMGAPLNPFLRVNAIDEIAAFNKARNMMFNLGFKPARDLNDC